MIGLSAIAFVISCLPGRTLFQVLPPSRLRRTPEVGRIVPSGSVWSVAANTVFTWVAWTAMKLIGNGLPPPSLAVNTGLQLAPESVERKIPAPLAAKTMLGELMLIERRETSRAAGVTKPALEGAQVAPPLSDL